MNTQIRLLALVVPMAGLLSSCASVAPAELKNAREAYSNASAGPAAQMAPAELHIAAKALGKAESAFQEDGNDFYTRDLAYVAHRKAQLADATAAIAIEKKNQSQSKDELTATQGKIVVKTKAELDEAQAALAAEQAARIAADRRASDSQAALAKLAAVKDEPRGMVITLSGSVLFASSKAILLPEARTRLDQVAEVLLTTKERKIVVEGHTDSQGKDATNLELSQRRADAVRNYLVERGYNADLFRAQGVGETHPVADNGNPEGRANNRRVELVIEREQQAAK